MSWKAPEVPKNVSDNLLKLVRAMKVHVQLGLIGLTGVIVPMILTVEPNLERVSVSMVEKSNVQAPPRMNSNVRGSVSRQVLLLVK